MSKEAVLALAAAAVLAAAVALSGIPAYLKALMLLSLVLMVTGAVHSNEYVVEGGFAMAYLVSVVYSAYSQADMPVLFTLALLSLALRDYLHVLSKGKTSGAGYLLARYMPLHILAAVVVYGSLLLEALPRMGAVPVALSAVVAVLILTQFLVHEDSRRRAT